VQRGMLVAERLISNLPGLLYEMPAGIGTIRVPFGRSLAVDRDRDLHAARQRDRLFTNS